MQIAEHHRPGHWQYGVEPPYQATKPWPEKCCVQWGGRGVVISKSGNYQTAFFEAFPGNNAGGFIRGEGAAVEEAEAAAFAKYERQVGCVHRWGRGKYLNGGAHCYRCKAFKTVFQPVHVLGEWRKPINKMENEMLDMPPMDQRGVEYRRKLRIRKRLFGVTDSYL